MTADLAKYLDNEVQTRHDQLIAQNKDREDTQLEFLRRITVMERQFMKRGGGVIGVQEIQDVIERHEEELKRQNQVSLEVGSAFKAIEQKLERDAQLLGTFGEHIMSGENC